MAFQLSGAPERKYLSDSELQLTLSGLAGEPTGGRQQRLSDRLEHLRSLIAAGLVPTMEPLLPLCLTLSGTPYELADHFPFSPLFKTSMAETTLFMTGRQVSKSTSIAAHGVMISNSIPYFRTLYVMPLYEQVRRFSNNYVRPFIERSPVKNLLTGVSTENSVLQRSFRNLSMMLFSFAKTDADRVRGVSCDQMAIDEMQDMDPDHIPIIREAMSHSIYEISRFTGTPKSTSNVLTAAWKESSQAEWIVPCYSCGVDNIPSIEHHLEKMIGPLHENISEKWPATVCWKCRRPIYPRHGHWVHRHPERRWLYAGYHVPQIIMPLHYASPKKWGQLLAKQRGWGNTTQAVFFNEVLGEPVDAGQKLISETQLRAASILPWKNNPDAPDQQVFDRLQHYKLRVLAVDWGGGGEKRVSFTTLALLGFTPGGEIHCLWGKRLVLSQEHMREALEVKHWMQRFACHLMAHDYTGAGIVRETVLVQAGLDLERMMPVQYVRAAAANLIKFVPASPLHNRNHYRLDKTRSLLYTFQAIKQKMLKFFRFDYVNTDDRGLIYDFTALLEDKTESRLAGDIYTIVRDPLFPDDFAQAVNIGCAAIWHAENAWPNYAAAAAVGQITEAQLLAAGSRDYGWEQDPMGGFLSMP